MPQNKELAPIRVIARRSKLSQLQVAEVFNRLKDIPYTIVFTDTFWALLHDDADIAIHSAKDLPEHLHPDLEVIALYEAFDKTDALVSRDHIKLMDLPAGSTVGTSSPLRKKGLSELRPDLKIVGIRGCIEDRVAQVRDGKLDCAIVATCALKRLGMEDEITEILPFPTHPMQGRLAITAKRGEAAENLKKWFAPGNILNETI